MFSLFGNSTPQHFYFDPVVRYFPGLNLIHLILARYGSVKGLAYYGFARGGQRNPWKVKSILTPKLLEMVSLHRTGAQHRPKISSFMMTLRKFQTGSISFAPYDDPISWGAMLLVFCIVTVGSMFSDIDSYSSF